MVRRPIGSLRVSSGGGASKGGWGAKERSSWSEQEIESEEEQMIFPFHL
jgi:hypothetical protein